MRLKRGGPPKARGRGFSRFLQEGLFKKKRERGSFLKEQGGRGSGGKNGDLGAREKRGKN